MTQSKKNVLRAKIRGITFFGLQSLFENKEDTLETADCIEVVKRMGLNYSCIDKDPDDPTKLKKLHLVSKNFQSFFLKVRHKMNNFELVLEKQLKGKKVLLRRLSHKIKDHQFAGVYKYEPNLGTLKYVVENEDLTEFDKYSYMKQLTRLVVIAHQERDPKNDFFNLDLVPSNILVLSEDPYSVRLIDIFPSSTRERIKFLYYLKWQDKTFIDSRARNVFTLGRLFYFICYKHFPGMLMISEGNLSNLKDDREHADLDLRMVSLIRRMLNYNPLDRPSLEIILMTIDEVLNSSHFVLDQAKKRVHYTYRKMTREVAQEIFNVKNWQRDFAKKQAKTQRQVHQKLLQKIDMPNLKKLQDFYDGLSIEQIRRFLNEVYTDSPRNSINKDDPHGMIDDTILLDFDPFSREKLDMLDLLKIKHSKYFNANVEVLDLIKEEIILYQEELHRDSNIKIVYEDNRLYFSSYPMKEKKQEDSKIFLVDLFLAFAYFEGQKSKKYRAGQHFDTVVESDQVSGDLKSLFHDIVGENNIPEKSFWKEVSKMDWKLVGVMVFVQIMSNVFLIIFFLRRHGFVKIKKEDFITYLVLK